MKLIDTENILQPSKTSMFSGSGAARVLMMLTRLNKVNKIYSNHSHKEGDDFINSFLEELEVKYEVSDEDLQRIPESGPFITVANHPFGGIDGLILLNIFARFRRDYKIFPNYLLQKIEPVSEYLLEINPFSWNSKDKNANAAIEKKYVSYLKEGGCMGVFPAGEVSTFYNNSKGITDKKWNYAAIKFIKNAKVPVVPVYFKGVNSMVFHLMGMLHPRLKMAKLPSELLKKRNKAIKVRIGHPISVKEQEEMKDISKYGRFLRAKTYALGTSLEVKRFFKSVNKRLKVPEPIIPAVDQSIIEKEVETVMNEHLLIKSNEFCVIAAPSEYIPNVLTEIGRLREITFREIGEGTNMKSDVDEYDLYYHQLFIWDEKNKKIVGAYRIGMGKEIIDEYGIKGFYSHSLFRISSSFVPVLQRSMELGRSFIVKEYQRKPMPLFLLWKGILYALLKNPDYKYLIGPVSITNKFSNLSKSLIIEFIKKNYYRHDFAKYIKPRKKFNAQIKQVDARILLEEANDIKKLDKTLKDIEPEDFGMPVLLKKYLGLNGKIIGFNRDPKFNNCLDGLLILDLYDVPLQTVSDFSKEINDDSIMERFALDTDPAISHRK
jgi:putative hemolysin